MALLTSVARRVRQPPPHLYFVGSAVFHYLGPSFAVLLFAVVPVAGVAWLRIVSAGVVFAVWRRPWRILTYSDTATRWLIAGLGAVFAVMNYSFYLAIAAVPLGTVAAIEFVGPIVLALIGSRSTRNLTAAVVAAGGVWLLTDVRLAGSAEGFAWAFINAALFTAYIVLAHRLASAAADTSPIDRLGAAMLVASVVITPIGVASAAPALTAPAVLAAGIGVGISSSVIPYVFDQLAMRRLPRETYSLFVALLPATAVVVGVIVLGQIPAAIEVVGVALVILGVAMHQERGTAGRHPPTHDIPTNCDQTRANTQRRTDSPAPTDLSGHHHSQSANEHNHRQVPSQVDECGPTGRDAARTPNPDYVGFGRGPGDGVMCR